MNSHQEYFCNKLKVELWEAISYLATANGDMRERLKVILIYGSLSTVEINQFPDELKPIWNKIENYITKYPEKYNLKGDVERGRIEETLSKIQNRTACKISTLILELYEEIINITILQEENNREV